MTCNTRNTPGDLVDKRDVDLERWLKAQGVIRQGQGRRAWRHEEPVEFKRALRLYVVVLALAVLALVAVAVAR